MIKVFFEGIAWGFLVAISIGPAFFSIIQTGIDRGFKTALYLALGILFCDAFLITICYLGLTSLFQKPENNIYIGFIGGIILIIYGTYSYLKKPDILRRRSPKYKTPADQHQTF
jgi:threonine/homoserine/homoserine lactone efflux protein